MENNFCLKGIPLLTRQREFSFLGFRSGNSAFSETKPIGKLMKTITGNVVRKPYSQIGQSVNSLNSAISAVGFEIRSRPVLDSLNSKPIANKQGLFRSDNDTCLDIHSNRFSFNQPADSLAVLERARHIVGGSWSSVKVNKGGRMIVSFIELEGKVVAPQRGDQIGLSIGHFDYFDGSGLEHFRMFANVIACNNGMTNSKALFSFSSKHIGNTSERIADLEGRLQYLFVQAKDEMQATVSQLDNSPMNRYEMQHFVAQLFPTKDEDNIPTRVLNLREQITTGFIRGTGNVGQTRFDAFNAVTEYLDWSSTFKETEFSREENRFESVLTGNVADVRARALELLLN